MIYGLYHSAAGGITQSAKVDMIANNLANVNTPGFRKDVMVFRDRLAEAIEDGPGAYANPILDRMNGGLFIDRTYYDRLAGPIAHTGRSLDVAIAGEGFFVVKRDGEQLYTRAGDFSVNALGELTTADGETLVLSNVGDPIPIRDPSKVTITTAGEVAEEIEVGGEKEVVAVLGTVLPSHPEQLRKVGATLFRYYGPGDEPTAYRAVVKQGYVEQSSVNPLTEMVAMIDALRSFESNMQMLRFQDTTLERVVNDVGRLPG